MTLPENGLRVHDRLNEPRPLRPIYLAPCYRLQRVIAAGFEESKLGKLIVPVVPGSLGFGPSTGGIGYFKILDLITRLQS